MRSNSGGISALRVTGATGALQDVVENDGASRAGEGLFAGQHLVEDGAEREEVAAGVDFFPAGLLGGHVLDGADGHAGAGE